uniref:Serine/threonine-protein phosphatase PGAM5, mitochondrial n=1 Tax=Meloidogyne enterolobii TaxID=390850 RepID=A0A6V7UZ34_MELEN|nr:unnamed protein product [Meloidogyne enterolobii]
MILFIFYLSICCLNFLNFILGMIIFFRILLLLRLAFTCLGAVGGGGSELLELPFDPTHVNWFEERGKRKWDINWDFRDPRSIVEHENELSGMTPQQLKDLIANNTPKATRNIFLIRHGQYKKEKAKEKKKLTPLGREQAEFLGKRLTMAKNQLKIDKCVFSTLIRARETGEIMAKQMPHLKIGCTLDSMLEEGAPYPGNPAHGWNPGPFQLHTDGARIEAAFRKYFHRAKLSQKEDSFELIVCHANVIRYFVCRILQYPPERWIVFNLAHTSITWIEIKPDGHIFIKTVGDFGHLPSGKITFNNV